MLFMFFQRTNARLNDAELLQFPNMVFQMMDVSKSGFNNETAVERGAAQRWGLREVEIRN